MLRQNFASLSREAPTKTLLARESKAHPRPLTVVGDAAPGPLRERDLVWDFCAASVLRLPHVLNGSTLPGLLPQAFKNHELQTLHLGGLIALVSTVWWPHAFDDGVSLD